MATKCGGLGPISEATAEVQELVSSVKAAVEDKCGRSFSEFTAKSYRSQVVAGKNYFVKVLIGNGEFLHLRLYKHFANDVALHNVQEGKAEEDEITYF